MHMLPVQLDVPPKVPLLRASKIVAYTSEETCMTKPVLVWLAPTTILAFPSFTAATKFALSPVSTYSALGEDSAYVNWSDAIRKKPFDHWPGELRDPDTSPCTSVVIRVNNPASPMHDADGACPDGKSLPYSVCE